jgi:hypothetical protein
MEARYLDLIEQIWRRRSRRLLPLSPYMKHRRQWLIWMLCGPSLTAEILSPAVRV